MQGQRDQPADLVPRVLEREEEIPWERGCQPASHAVVLGELYYPPPEVNTLPKKNDCVGGYVISMSC